MLEPNRLSPPHPLVQPPAAARTPSARHGQKMFLSADDFDATGVLSGCDPCASSYWWMPDLHGAPPAELAVAAVADAGESAHATRRTEARPQAAA